MFSLSRLFKLHGTLEGYDLHSMKALNEVDLNHVLHHRFFNLSTAYAKDSFFVIPSKSYAGVSRFGTEATEVTQDVCNSAPWFMYVRGGLDTHIVIPRQSWYHIEPDSKRYVEHIVHASVWDVGGGVFQLDKMIHKPVYYADVLDVDCVLGLFKHFRKLDKP
jgi:hypothetical protein